MLNLNTSIGTFCSDAAHSKRNYIPVESGGLSLFRTASMYIFIPIMASCLGKITLTAHVCLSRPPALSSCKEGAVMMCGMVWAWLSWLPTLHAYLQTAHYLSLPCQLSNPLFPPTSPCTSPSLISALQSSASGHFIPALSIPSLAIKPASSIPTLVRVCV